MDMQPKQQGMPSILDGIPSPFSGTRPSGMGDDFDTVYKQWQTAQTPDNNTKLLKTVQPIIDTALTSYAGGQPSPAMRTKAKLMALKAMSAYNPNKGNVKTHLLSQLQSLRRAAAQENNIISIPEQVGLDFQHLTETENQIRDQFGRDPTDDELADATGLSKRRIQKIKSFHQPVPESATITENEDDTFDGGVASQIPGANNAYNAWLDFVYEDLGPTDRLIMDMTLGRNGKRRTSNQQIAQRLRLSPGAISQRAAKIQAMIDRRHNQNGF